MAYDKQLTKKITPIEEKASDLEHSYTSDDESNPDNLLKKQKHKFLYFNQDSAYEQCLFKHVSDLESGSSFGELSLITKKCTRTASIIGSSKRIFILSITKEQYVNIIDNN